MTRLVVDGRERAGTREHPAGGVAPFRERVCGGDGP